MAVVAPAAEGFSAEAVALVFGFLFLWLAITVIDAVRPPAVNLAGAVPLVGNALRGAVDSAFGAARAWLYSYLSQALVAYASLLSWLDTLWASTVGIVENFAAATSTALWRLDAVIIPHAVAVALAAAITAVNQARTAAAAAVAGAEAEARNLVAAAEARAVALFQAAEADAVKLAAAERAAAQGLFQVAEQDIAAAAEAERAFVVNRILGVEAEIEAASQKVLNLTAAAEAQLRGDLGAVERELSGSIQQEVNALLRQIAADKAALESALSGGLAAVVADVAAIRALECIQRCAQLSALGQALDLLSLGALWALLELILHEPKTFQEEWLNGVQPLIASTVADVRAALGV